MIIPHNFEQHGNSYVIQNHAGMLSLLPRLSDAYNARIITQSPSWWPGYISLSFFAVDDSVIPSDALRERAEPLYFQNVLVREDVSVLE